MDVTLQRTNKVVLITNWFLDSFLFLGYIGEYLKGGKSLGYVLVFLALVLIPMIAAQVLYVKRKDSPRIKYVTIIGFFILYSFALFSSTRILTFVYIIPIVLNYMLYFNLKLITWSVITIVVLNIARVFQMAVIYGINDKSSTTDYTIQMACVILVAIALYVTTKLSNIFSDEKISKIQQEKEYKERISREIQEQTSVLFNSVDLQNNLTSQFNEKLQNQSSSFIKLKESLEKLLNKADAIRHISTEQLDSNEIVESSISEYKDIQLDTKKNLDNTLENMSNILEQSNTTESMLSQVESTVSNIKEQSDRIQQAVEIIVDIADRINLLSLNASIEAARAGDSGRGFAVVADEIGKLALQTSDSIGEIKTVLSLNSQATDEGVTVIKNTAGNIKNMLGAMHENSNKIESLQQSILNEESHINKVIDAMKKNMEMANKIGNETDEQKSYINESSELIQILSEALNNMNDQMSELSSTSKEIFNSANQVVSNIEV